MSAAPALTYDRFITLAELELAAYMEPLLNDPSVRIPRDILENMVSDLPTYDEYHLVYALQLGADHSPETFAPHVPQYLAHEHGSVCCTAYNILDRLSDEYLTQDLVNSVRSVLSSHAVRKFVVGVLERLEERLQEKQRKKQRGEQG